MLAPRAAGSLADTQCLEPVGGGARIVRVAARELEEVRELGLVRVAEADEERRIRGSGERGRVRLDAAPRCARVDSDSERVFRGMDLDVNVVSGLVVPESGDEAECAVGRLHEHRGRRDVDHLLVMRRAERRAGRAHLGVTMTAASTTLRAASTVSTTAARVSAATYFARAGSASYTRSSVTSSRARSVDACAAPSRPTPRMATRIPYLRRAGFA